MTEQWQYIPDTDNEAEVSNLGEVRHKGNRLPQEVRKGYLSVKIPNLGIRKVHRLVAHAFCPQREGCRVVNHLDFNKLNNRAENLEWVTEMENRRHYYESLNHSDGTPLTWDTVRKLRHERKGRSIAELGSEFCLDPLLVANILSYETWRELIPKGLRHYDRELDKKKSHSKAKKPPKKYTPQRGQAQSDQQQQCPRQRPGPDPTRSRRSHPLWEAQPA